MSRGKAAATPEQPLASQHELARQRAELGFDDIPIASAAEVRQDSEKRQRVGKWAKRQRFVKFFKNKEYLQWKEDLEWAMKADRDNSDAQQPATSAKPEAAAPRRAARRIHVPERGEAVRLVQPSTPQPIKAVPAAADSHKTIDININFGVLPKLPRLRPAAMATAIFARVRRIRWNRRTQIVSGIVAMAVAGGGVFLVYNVMNGTFSRAVTSTTIAQTPTYQTVTPSGKAASSLKWQRVSPANSNPVFAYADTIDGVSVFVSQQPIPDNFQPNVDDHVAQLAAAYTATDKISAGSTPIYVGTSAQGPQSAIFSKNNLLVLIKSASKISDDAWASYVNSLQ